MPQIYEVINLYNQERGLVPYKYIGSDQNDNDDYYGSSSELQNDIRRIGKEFFIKKTLKFFDTIDNKVLRKIESEILKENEVKESLVFYNKNQNYSPGCGVKGMKHRNKKIVSENWKESKRGWNPSEETRKIWKEQRKNRFVSEETRQKMSLKTQGSKNPNALRWKVIYPCGKIIEVIGLRKWCNDNNLNYYRIYHQKDGFSLIKYGSGNGGPQNANK
jgi:hypothetical protein